MLPIFAIQFMEQSASVLLPVISTSFLNQPIDVILLDILVWFGWIPIAVTLLWGFSQLWKYERQVKFSGGLNFICLAIDVPAMTEQTPKALENLFSTLYGTKSSITFLEEWFLGKLIPVFSFEIISEEGYIQFIVRTQAKFRDLVESGIYAQYPDAEVIEIEDYATKLPTKFPDEKYDAWGVEFVLDKPSHYPIRTYVDFEDQMTGEIKDPLGATLEHMSKMRPGEHFWFQMLIQPMGNEWNKVGIQHVNKIFGVEEKKKVNIWEEAMNTLLRIPFDAVHHATEIDLSHMFGISGDEQAKEVDPWKAFKLGPAQQDEAKAIMKKTVKVAHGTKIRVVYAAEKAAFRKGERASTVKGFFNQYTHLNLNSFKMYMPSIPKDDYPWQAWSYTRKQTNLMTGYINRSWGIGATPYFLNAEELATLWHFPTINIKAPLVKKAEARRAEPPVGLPVTFLENTLPGYHDESEDLPEQVRGSIIEEDHEEKLVDLEPLSDALPSVLSPTDASVPVESENKFMQDRPVVDENDQSFSPPNLPV